MSPAIFLDRDGTINEEIGYLHKIKDWKWCSGALESIVSVKKTSFKLIVISNQAGIARGYYSKKDVFILHEWFHNQILNNYGELDAIYFCPHHPRFGQKKNCKCRKPSSGMILEAEKDLNLNLNLSWLIGDKVSDVEAGKNVGLKTILLPDSNNNNSFRKTQFADFYKKNLKLAIEFVLAEDAKSS